MYSIECTNCQWSGRQGKSLVGGLPGEKQRAYEESELRTVQSRYGEETLCPACGVGYLHTVDPR